MPLSADHFVRAVAVTVEQQTEWDADGPELTGEHAIAVLYRLHKLGLFRPLLRDLARTMTPHPTAGFVVDREQLRDVLVEHGLIEPVQDPATVEP